MKDGLYRVETKKITGGFVVRDGQITMCAPVLRKKIDYWKGMAQYVPTDTSIPPPVTEEEED